MILLLFLVIFQTTISTLTKNSIEEREHVCVISDTHIGGPWFSNGLGPSNLPKFLLSLTSRNTTFHTLIINGDFLDLWLFNFTEKVPTVLELLKSTGEFGKVNVSEYVEILKSIIENNIRIIYINGNHDDLLTWEDFRDVGLEKIEFYKNFYEEFNYNVAHGHEFDLFNSPDPGGLRAFGFFMMRACTEVNQIEMQEVSKLYQWACQHLLFYEISHLTNATFLYERLIGGSLGEKIWTEVINKRYEKYKNREITNACFFNSKCRDKVVLKVATRKYRRMIENLMSAACLDNDYWIEIQNKDLFIMGHTHYPELSIYRRKTIKGGYVVYANTGAWLTFNKWLPFLKIKQQINKHATFIQLMNFDHKTGEHIVVKESEVPFKYSSKKFGIIKKSNKKIFNSTCNKECKNYIRESEKYKNKKKKKVPKEWTCDIDFYNSNDGCDCNCGTWDPDCIYTYNKKNECIESCETF